MPASLRGSRGSNTNNAAASDVPAGTLTAATRSWGWMAAAGLARSASCERVRMGAQFGWRGKVSRRLQVRSVLMKAVWSLPGRWPIPERGQLDRGSLTSFWQPQRWDGPGGQREAPLQGKEWP